MAQAGLFTKLAQTFKHLTKNQPENKDLRRGNLNFPVEKSRNLIFFLKVLYIPDANSLLRFMAEVCTTCGLPKDLCVCGEIEKEQERIRIRLETRKFGRPTTIIDGIDNKNSNLSNVAQKLKSFCACGGTSKNGQIMLQGDHRDRVRIFLVKIGYPQENIEVQ